MESKEQEIITIEDVEPVDMVAVDPTADVPMISTGVKLQINSWKEMYEMAEYLSKSTIVPTAYQRRPENVFVALEYSSRTNMSPFIVMNNLHIIQGKPSLSGALIASMVKSSSRFTNVTLHKFGKEGTMERGAVVTGISTETGERVIGDKVTMKMADDEGWLNKSGSKWKTMPEIMLGYRAYAFFGRIHLPDVLLGMHTTEEVVDAVSKTGVIDPFEDADA